MTPQAGTDDPAYASDDLADEARCFLDVTDVRRPALWKDPSVLHGRLHDAGPVHQAPDGQRLATTFYIHRDLTMLPGAR